MNVILSIAFIYAVVIVHELGHDYVAKLSLIHI